MIVHDFNEKDRQRNLADLKRAIVCFLFGIFDFSALAWFYGRPEVPPPLTNVMIWLGALSGLAGMFYLALPAIRDGLERCAERRLDNERLNADNGGYVDPH